MNKSAELIGYFVEPEVWVKMVLKHVKLTQAAGALMLLASVLQGCQRSTLKPYLADITSVLVDPEICRSSEVRVQVYSSCLIGSCYILREFQVRMQTQLLRCVDALMSVCGDVCVDNGLEIFTVVITVLALCKTETTRLTVRPHEKI